MIMMQGTYYKEWSSVLNREMEFKVYGSAGVPVLALPAHLELWGGDVSHDWYWWGKMWSLFAPRILEK